MMPDDTPDVETPEAGEAPAETGWRSELGQAEERIAAEKGVDDTPGANDDADDDADDDGTPVRACARRGLRVWRQSEASLDTSTHGRVCARHGVL